MDRYAAQSRQPSAFTGGARVAVVVPCRGGAPAEVA